MFEQMFLGIFCAIFILCFIFGYIANIVRLAHADSIKGFEAVRMVGIFVPLLGVILGFISNRKGV